MHHIGELADVPVLEIETGKQIGTVEDALISLTAHRLQGLVVVNAAWFSQKRKIMFSEIFQIGRDAVMVRSDAAGVPYDEKEVDRVRLCDFGYLRDKSIFSESGLHLGTLTDLAFDPETGEIKSYQISDGAIADLLHGRRSLPTPQAEAVCEDRIILPESAVRLLHS